MKEKGNAVRDVKFLLYNEKIDFQTEYRFHLTRKWLFDFAIIKDKIAIEIHGGVFQQGRHTRGKGFENDREKINAATCLGWRVLEYSTNQAKKNPTQILWDIAEIKSSIF